MSALLGMAIMGIILLVSGMIVFRKVKSTTHIAIALLLVGLGILSLLILWGLFLMTIEDAPF